MFSIPDAEAEDGPDRIFTRLLMSHGELRELAEMMESGVTLRFLMRSGEWTKGGRTIWGTCYLADQGFQGPLKDLAVQLLDDMLGALPHFLVVLSDDWWQEATPLEREVLVFHEVLHAGHAKDRYGEPRFNRETGDPIICIQPHDVEEFDAVVARYGTWSPDLERFAAALDRGRK
jgi:hypothetical protein